MKRAALLVASLLIAAAVAVPALGTAASSEQPLAATTLAKKKKKRMPKVKVADDYFSPTLLKVKQRTRVNFKWLKTNGNPHNVTLTRGPKSLTKRQKRKFKSATGSIGIRFKPTFRKRGTYKFICTIHPGTMKTTVKVKRRRR